MYPYGCLRALARALPWSPAAQAVRVAVRGWRAAMPRGGTPGGAAAGSAPGAGQRADVAGR
eukprot:7376087-Lingulodinium_polyedra.AAC.1